MRVILALLALYLGVALLTASATFRYALHTPPLRWEQLERLERALLLTTGVLAGALWPVLFPILARGWVRDRLPKRIARMRRRLEARRIERGARGLPAATLSESSGSLLPPTSESN